MHGAASWDAWGCKLDTHFCKMDTQGCKLARLHHTGPQVPSRSGSGVPFLRSESFELMGGPVAKGSPTVCPWLALDWRLEALSKSRAPDGNATSWDGMLSCIAAGAAGAGAGTGAGAGGGADAEGGEEGGAEGGAEGARCGAAGGGAAGGSAAGGGCMAGDIVL